MPSIITFLGGKVFAIVSSHVAVDIKTIMFQISTLYTSLLMDQLKSTTMEPGDTCVGALRRNFSLSYL